MVSKVGQPESFHIFVSSSIISVAPKEVHMNPFAFSLHSSSVSLESAANCNCRMTESKRSKDSRFQEERQTDLLLKGLPRVAGKNAKNVD